MKFLLSFLLTFSFVWAQTSAGNIRMNQVRVLGTHNSYKQAIEPALFQMLTQQPGGERMQGLEYAHLPIPQQLDMGLRALEIDVVYDPQGGLYAHPKGLDLVPGSPYDPKGEMRKPGFKVLHVPDIDFRANVYTFQEELAVLKAWSEAHPRHLPISITMNAKDEGLKRPGFVTPLKFDAVAYAAWDAEILQGLGRGKVIVPDDVRGKHATLEEAVLAQDWPALDKARGKFLFVLDEGGKKMDLYRQGHASLRGRVMFINAPEGEPEAAVRIVNEPKENWAYIQHLVQSGYLVRTRADADTVEARKNDYSRWRAALLSGAQIISTDYPVANAAFGNSYHVRFPENLPGLWEPLLLPAMRPLPAIE